MRVLIMLWALGGASLLGAVYSVFYVKKFNETAIATKGVVTRFIIEKNKYTPVVDFYTKEGEKVTIISSFSSSPFGRGEEVTVYYKADNPQDARIDSFITNWLVAMTLSGLGFTICIVAFLIRLFLKNKLDIRKI